MDTKSVNLKIHFISALFNERQRFRKICRNNEKCFTDADPNKELSTLEIFVSNPGFYGIANSIFSQLDCKSLANCRMTSKYLKKFIDNQDFWMQSQLEMLSKIDGLVSMVSLVKKRYRRNLKIPHFSIKRSCNEGRGTFTGSADFS